MHSLGSRPHPCMRACVHKLAFFFDPNRVTGERQKNCRFPKTSIFRSMKLIVCPTKDDQRIYDTNSPQGSLTAATAVGCRNKGRL